MSSESVIKLGLKLDFGERLKFSVYFERHGAPVVTWITLWYRMCMPLIWRTIPENVVKIRRTVDFWSIFQDLSFSPSNRGRPGPHRRRRIPDNTQRVQGNNHCKFHLMISCRCRS